MPKSARRKSKTVAVFKPQQVTPTPPAFPQVIFDPTWKYEQRDVVSSKDGWSEFTLNDGSVIRLKAVILDAKRAVGQFGVDGEPTYIMQITVVSHINAPKSLKRSSAAKKARRLLAPKR
jgi:hypothetical protein